MNCTDCTQSLEEAGLHLMAFCLRARVHLCRNRCICNTALATRFGTANELTPETGGSQIRSNANGKYPQISKDRQHRSK